MNSDYDKTLRNLDSLANIYAKQEESARIQERQQYEKEQINLYNKSRSETMTSSTHIQNLDKALNYDNSYDMDDEIRKFRQDKLREEMAPIYFLMDKYMNLLQYLPILHQQVISYATNSSYTKFVRDIAKNIDASLQCIQNFLNDKIIGVLDRDESISHVLRTHLDNIDLFNFSPDRFWHELNKDIAEFRHQKKIKETIRANELKELDLKHQHEIERINAIEQRKQELIELFSGWLKVDKDGNPLSADSSTWYALQDLSSRLMWASSNKFTFPNLVSINFDKNFINAHLNKVNHDGWCNYHDWRLPTLKELYDLYSIFRKREILYDMDSLPKENQRFWSADPLKVMFFSTGITSKLDSNQKCHIRLVRDINPVTS